MRRAYKLRKKCQIDAAVTRKLKEVMQIIKVEKELNLMQSAYLNEASSGGTEATPHEDVLKLMKIYEKLGDSYCNIGIYELGLKNYLEQLKHCKRLNQAWVMQKIKLIY